MTVIRPNSISGVSSITAQGGDINVYRADGTKSDIFINNITGVAATFTGNLNVGGVLTYEDVTNIDSVGVVTARTDINLGDSIIHIGDTNTKIRFPAADTITAETGGSERLRITSDGALLMGVTTSQQGDANLQVFRAATTSRITFGNENVSASGIAGIDFCPSNKVMGSRIECQASEDFSTSANRTADLVFFTRKDGTSSEKLRIGSAGQFGLGGANYGSSGQVLTSAGSGSAVTWSTISGTTISNNADDRLITGTGTANTINAEADLTFDGTNLKLTDHKNMYFGTGNDLRIWHDANNSYSQISSGQMNFYIDGLTTYMRSGNGSSGVENAIVMNNNASVDLYYSGTKKFETVTGGIKVTGAYALAASSGNNPTIDNADGGNGRNMYFKTGGSLRLVVQSDGHVRPGSDNVYDLGTSSDRWRNLYTTDLQLSNKGSQNDVDGTWGDWTLQEGENKIFMINNRTGKKYSLKMEEE